MRRRYDNGLVSCVWLCHAFSQRKCDKQIDYAPLMAKDGGELRERCDARGEQHLTATHCDTAKLREDERRVAKRAISTSCREDHRKQVNMVYSTIWRLLNVVATVGKCPG